MQLNQQVLRPYRLKAFNYATGHANRIHEDTVAASHGFAGGLVTGIALYAYLLHPLLEATGPSFYDGSSLRVRFLQPVYDQEEMSAEPVVKADGAIEVSLKDSNGLTRAFAGLTAADYREEPAPGDFTHFCPSVNALIPEARIANLRPGMPLSSLDWINNPTEQVDGFLRDMKEELELFRGANPICHPAFLLAQANEILMRNVRLGPWIHTGSDVCHYRLPGNGSRLSLRGEILESFERKGHELVTLKLALFEDEAKPIASIRHTAIIHLRTS